MSILLKDQHNITDSIEGKKMVNNILNAGPKKNRILIVDHDTGEVLQEVNNKILIPGSQITACKQFGLEDVVKFPTYNSILGLDESHEDYSVQPLKDPVTCLWAAGRDGFLSSPAEIIEVSNTDHIKAEDLVPFRHVTIDNDLDDDNRKIYFGRKTDVENNTIDYYFKAFDTNPVLHVRYLDGTQVTHNVWDVDSSQQVEVYVELRLSVNRLDFREYFELIGWENADISSVSLITAWAEDIVSNPDARVEDQKKYRYFHDCIPYTKYNFKAEDLSERTRAIDFIYQLYY